jgi:Bacterial PH domain
MRAVNLEKLLPADIPPGERVLWFGRPEPTSLWRRAYRAEWVGGWFALMTIWNFVSITMSDSAFAGFVSALKTLGFGAAALAILSLLAWLSASTTFYVITERRIVLKTGIALPLFLNLPFKQIASANVRAFADGTGEVTVSLTEGQRVPYLVLWPSARPLRFARPEPALRCVVGPREVADTLGRALAEASGQAPAAPARATVKSAEPSRVAAALA